MPTTYAYIRVSTVEQNEDRQLFAMHDAGVEEKNIFLDKQSGKDFNRPKYQRMLKKLRHGDTLFIKSIDRLGRNYEEIIKQWRHIVTDLGVDIVVLDMPLLDTRQKKNLIGTLISDIVLQLLSYVSETERTNIRQRQAEGIAAAKKRGVRFGRPSKSMPSDFAESVVRWSNGEISTEEILRYYEISRATLYRRKKELNAATK